MIEVVVTLYTVVIFSSLYIQIVKEPTKHCGFRLVVAVQ